MVSPYFFLPVRPRFSTILRKFAHIFFLSGVTPGAVRPHTPPPNDATDKNERIYGRRENDDIWSPDLCVESRVKVESRDAAV